MTVLALTGGVGGAKLALGLVHVLEPSELVFLVNTGDDFSHLGLHISPDVDTLLYTLSNIADPERGWGRKDESWNFMDTLENLGGETWFQLGDRDMALHHYRTQQLATGVTFTKVTNDLANRLGVGYRILPMSDQPIRTEVETDRGSLSFQHYFVRERCEPAVRSIRYIGASEAHLNPLLSLHTIDKVLICPSNPYLSVDPMLSLPELRSFLKTTSAPVVAVSPIVKGMALKGPTAKLMRELGVAESALSVAEHYRDLIDGFVLDETDADLETQIRELGLSTNVQQTIMRTLEDRIDLAAAVVEFAESLHDE